MIITNHSLLKELRNFSTAQSHFQAIKCFKTKEFAKQTGNKNNSQVKVCN